jgi:acetylornithine deacetylase/succinyl-diaminopimelate desuccinylase-like protein
MTAIVEEVIGRIKGAKDDLADLSVRLGNTFGPFGHERATACEALSWYQENGIDAELMDVAPDRANVVARIPGSGGGRSLLFNAHLDTEASGPDYDNLMQVPDVNKSGGRRDGDYLLGHTILNDRGCMSAFMVAGRALLQCGVPLKGDVVLTSVVGETGAAPVDEYEGSAYEGKGFGSTELLKRGVRADYALVAETTDYAMSWFSCGAMYVKVTLRGRNMYTPRLARGEDLARHPNAIVKAASVIQAIEAWAIEREERRTQVTSCGVVRPKAQVGAVRGGMPWRPNRSSPYCALYVDVRLLPGEDPNDVANELGTAIADAGLDAEIEIFMAKAGFEGQGVEPLVAAVSRAHEIVNGAPPPSQAETAVVSMWRDTNVFNGAGIPSLTFGPSRGDASVQGTGQFHLDDLVAAANIYALTALQISGDPSAQDLP